MSQWYPQSAEHGHRQLSQQHPSAGTTARRRAFPGRRQATGIPERLTHAVFRWGRGQTTPRDATSKKSVTDQPQLSNIQLSASVILRSGSDKHVYFDNGHLVAVRLHGKILARKTVLIFRLPGMEKVISKQKRETLDICRSQYIKRSKERSMKLNGHEQRPMCIKNDTYVSQFSLKGWLI